MRENKFQKDPTLPEGRQSDPTVASSSEIKNQQRIAQGDKFKQEEPVMVDQVENPNENHEEVQAETVEQVETNQAATEAVEADEEVHTGEASVTAEINVGEGISTEQPEVETALSEEAEGYDSEEDESYDSEEDEDEELIEDSLDLFEEVLSPLEFNQINNTLIITIPVDMEIGAEFDEETSEILQAIPGLELEGSQLVETDAVVNAFNPFDKDTGWFRDTLPALLKLVNNMSKQRLPILAGTNQMNIASELIANNVSSALYSIAMRESFGSSDALSGFVNAEAVAEFAAELEDEGMEAELDAGEIAEVAVEYGLENFFNVASYYNSASPTAFNIVNNFELLVPNLYEKNKPAVYLTKLIAYLRKQVQASTVPVFLNFTFTTIDLAQSFEARDIVDALAEAGCQALSRTQALDALEDEEVLPQEIAVDFATDLDKLFGTGDLTLNIHLNPVVESDSDE